MLVDSSISVVGLGYLVATHPTEASIAKYSFHVALVQQTYRENKEHAVRERGSAAAIRRIIQQHRALCSQPHSVQ